MNKMLTAVVASNLVCGALTSTEMIPISYMPGVPEGIGASNCDLAITFECDIPDSFFEALADFEKGRTTALDIALTEPPPDA